MDELITRSNISPADYKTLYSLFVFDVSKRSEKLKSSVVDVQIRAIFNQAVPAGTQAYAVVMSNKLLTFQSDGSRCRWFTNIFEINIKKISYKKC